MRRGFQMQMLRVLYENAHNTEMDEEQVHIIIPTCPPDETIAQNLRNAPQTHPSYSKASSSKQTALLQPQCRNGLLDCYCMQDNGIYRACKLLQN